jgi:uncharacterized protein YoxC
MGSDQLIELLSQVSYKLLPVAGLILLIFLIVFFKGLIDAMKSLKETLETTNDQIRKLDKPLETVEDLSNTIDKVHNASKGAIGKGINIAKDGLDTVVEKMQKKKENNSGSTIIVEEVVEDEKE